MADERTRILRMLAEGKISVEECDELLNSLSARRTEKIAQDVAGAKGKRPIWPYILLVLLGIVAIPMLMIGVAVVHMLLAGFSGPLAVLLLGFWIWMLVDWIRRPAEDFRLVFAGTHRVEKWVWCAIVLLGTWIGAAAYYFVIYREAEKLTLPKPATTSAGQPAAGPAEKRPEEPFTPKPRARSLLWFVLAGVLLASATALVVRVVGLGPLPGDVTVLQFTIGIPMVFFAAWVTLLFWLWMLIDCLARDYREFGTLVTSDRSVDKVLWLLLILFTFCIGGLAYHLSIRRRRRDATPAAGAPATGGACI